MQFSVRSRARSLVRPPHSHFFHPLAFDRCYCYFLTGVYIVVVVAQHPTPLIVDRSHTQMVLPTPIFVHFARFFFFSPLSRCCCCHRCRCCRRRWLRFASFVFVSDDGMATYKNYAILQLQHSHTHIITITANSKIYGKWWQSVCSSAVYAADLQRGFSTL